ncbi:hypothetical protein [uncultured Hoeflea sp.]|uniref:hypothetical protein n=1 Tax=uncultured Hoeflea sp. TaxID=538666 RepID=UPI0030ECD132|tara:strand:- start:50581 stop:50838 length:258 start_codon:yes stop_codon:yes gene_type:complete
MTNEEMIDHIENANAQAAAAQDVLMALLHVLRGKVLSDEVLNSAFDLAAETYTVGSYSAHKRLSAHSTRTLQAVEHMRQTLIRHK